MNYIVKNDWHDIKIYSSTYLWIELSNFCWRGVPRFPWLYRFNCLYWMHSS